jgi:hypothetical protein
VGTSPRFPTPLTGGRCELLAKVNGTDAFGKQHTYAARVFAQ